MDLNCESFEMQFCRLPAIAIVCGVVWYISDVIYIYLYESFRPVEKRTFVCARIIIDKDALGKK